MGLLAMALAAAACSSGTSTGASTKSSTATSASSTASTAPIVVGGLQDGNWGGIDTGFEARIARFNNAGGVNGRKIKFDGVLNDDDSPATDLTNAQTLVLKDHVFAVTPIASQVLGTPTATLLRQNTTPYIGLGIDPGFCDNDWAFPIIGCEASAQYQSTSGFSQLATAIGKPAKGLRVAVVGTDNAGGKSGTQGLAAAIGDSGEVVAYAQASVPQDGITDYSPYVQAIMATNPELIFLVIGFQSSVGLTAGLREAGYKGAIFNPTAYVPGLLSAEPSLAQALDGSLVEALLPPGEDKTPAVLQIESDLKAMGASPTYSLGEAVGWWSAEEFIQELQATAAKGPITQANFEKVINAGWSLKPIAGGITGASFPAYHVKPGGCGDILRVSGTRYLLEAPYVCNPAAIVNVG